MAALSSMVAMAPLRAAVAATATGRVALMSRIGRSSQISPTLGGVCYGQTRLAGYFTCDYKPGPTPKTEAERLAAAKKYNLIYEDYKPLPDDSEIVPGDYPDLTPVSGWSRDPYGLYDFPALKRNYGEPMHFEFLRFISVREDISRKPRYSLTLMNLTFVGIMLAAILIQYLLYTNELFLVLTPVPSRRQIPQEGVVHYTFEPAD